MVNYYHILAENQPTETMPSEEAENSLKFIEAGLDWRIASKLDEMVKSGKLDYAGFDKRAFEALKEFRIEEALEVLSQFAKSNLDHVSNKSAYLCGIMKTYRQKMKLEQIGQSVEEFQSSNRSYVPDPERIKKISTNGYELDVTAGQRRYFLPCSEEESTSKFEVFCGRIPADILEDELLLLFEPFGKLLDLRLMMNPIEGTNRGFAFITYATREAAIDAVQHLNVHEIRPYKFLKVNLSVPNIFLYVGNIPKKHSKQQIFEEFNKLVSGLKNVIIYKSLDDDKNNRGFCFLEFESHKLASQAKRRLGTGRVCVWNCEIIVDWADPQEQPDDEIMNKVKILFVRNLVQSVTEEILFENFSRFGELERIKKIKDFAFIHFQKRKNAELAMKSLNGRQLCGVPIEITFAKPPIDKKKKEEIFHARERRMQQILLGRTKPSSQQRQTFAKSFECLFTQPPPIVSMQSHLCETASEGAIRAYSNDGSSYYGLCR